MAFSTDEFQIDKLRSSVSRVSKAPVCIFENQLHSISVNIKGFDLDINHVHLDLKRILKTDSKSISGLDLIDSEVLKNEQNWISEKFISSINWTYGNVFDLTSNSSSMFCLFSNKGYLYAREYTSSESNQPPTWGPQIELLAPGSSEGSRVGSVVPISAKFFGANQLLVAACGTSGATAKKILLFLYDVRDIGRYKTGEWSARSFRPIDINSDIEYYFHNGKMDVGFTAAGENIDIDWFVVAPPRGAKTDEPTYHLAVNFSPDGPTVSGKTTNHQYSFTGYFQLPLKGDGSGEIEDQIDKTFIGDKLKFSLRGEGRESGLKRDPSGRLRRFGGLYPGATAPLNGEIGSIIIPTDVLPTVASFSKEAWLQPSYKTTDKVTKPAGEFYLFEAGKTKPKAPAGFDSAIEIPVLEFLLYGDGKCQVQEYGRVRMVQTTSEPISKPDIQTSIIGGYIDAPIPFPLENFVGQKVAAEGHDSGTFAYGNDNKTVKEISTEEGWTAGFESEGKTTKGVGPAWKVAIEGGMGSLEKNTVETELKRQLTIKGEVQNPAPFKEPRAEGVGQASTLNARFHIAGYQFFDASGALINDALTGNPAASAKMAAKLTTMSSAHSAQKSFESFVVDTGDLRSYTPEAINERMRKLGYEDNNYFRKIICTNAFPMTGDQPYLLYTWTEGNASNASFEQFRSQFLEQSWEFNSSVYAGVSFAVGINFFGIGEELDGQFLAGGTYSKSHSTAEDKSSKWGLEIEGNEWGPLHNPENENSVKSYSFRAYFLPVPQKPSILPKTYWAEELRANLPDKVTSKNPKAELTKPMVDPGSGCWRIAFVVTEIRYYEGRSDEDYTYDQTGDPLSVYHG